ncbi:MAG: PilN domain-containing protein [Acidobacteria bacterium]|nr:PilN domain-containing protein [Acidobacteriota bacterium]
MIRINLLGTERLRARKAIAFDIGQRLTAAAGAILVVAAVVVGWWYWSLRSESTQLDADLAAAQQEAVRLRSLLAEVQQFERQRALVEQRVALIEQLRSGQSIPVQLLDHVSRSVPDLLWLTALEQEDDEVTIEGRSTTLIALSDFVGNLGGNPILQRPIEIVNSQVQPASGTGADAVPELIQFTVRARINRPSSPEAPAGGAGRGAAAGGRQGGAR